MLYDSTYMRYLGYKGHTSRQKLQRWLPELREGGIRGVCSMGVEFPVWEKMRKVLEMDGGDGLTTM